MKRLMVLILALGCQSGRTSRDAGAPKRPAESVTVWTEKLELFVEYPALVAGEESRFAVHTTVLAGWKPVEAAAVSLTLRMDDGNSVRAVSGERPAPGIFLVVLKPARPGACTLTAAIVAPDLEGEIPLGPCQVHASASAIPASQEQPVRITFLKEQQWRTDFASAPVVERELQPSVRATGEIRPVAGKEARLAATTPGRVNFSAPTPVLGMMVRKGQVLATVAPRLTTGTDRSTLDAEISASRAELTAAEAQLARAERLFADQSIPKKEVEQARAAAEVTRARVRAAEGRLAQFTTTAAGTGGRGSFQVRSPIDGTLVTVDVASGETVEEGKTLFTVMDLRRVWLAAQVFEPDIPRVERTRGGWFTLEGYDHPFIFDAENARLITLGRVIDPQTRTVPLIFEIDNADGRLRIGQFAKIGLATGAPVRALAVPDTAVVDEAGKPVVYVQTEGETFERRPVKAGIQSLGWTGVLEGLRPGDRVVTKGAYEVRLASASGSIPTHGHAH